MSHAEPYCSQESKQSVIASAFCEAISVLSSPHVFGGDPEYGEHLPWAIAKLRSGFPIEAFGNDKGFVQIASSCRQKAMELLAMTWLYVVALRLCPEGIPLGRDIF